MKHTVFLVLISGGFLIPTLAYATPEYEVQIKSKWEDLEQSTRRTKQFGGKWIWAGTFVFKKRSRDPISLSSLDISWEGKKIKHLTGSLFKKESNKDLLPVEDALLSDGKWNSTQQTLHFAFNESENLNPVNTFCLVLTIPKRLESVLRKGHFVVKQTTLPSQFQSVVKKRTLSFSLKPPPSIRTQKLSFYRKKGK